MKENFNPTELSEGTKLCKFRIDNVMAPTGF
jgi:hypothetical protein